MKNIQHVLNKIETQHIQRLQSLQIDPHALQGEELLRFWDKAWVYPHELSRTQLEYIKNWLAKHSISEISKMKKKENV